MYYVTEYTIHSLNLRALVSLVVQTLGNKKVQVKQVKRNIQARLLNNFCYGKAISVTYSDCVSVVLFVQHEDHMRCIILSSLASMDLPYFPHYLIKATIFERNCIEYKMYLLIFSTTFVGNVYHLKDFSNILS